ncbi:hypothetical protein DRQ33_06225 [bacterium]|nr:MAG: hypothetical protein DRQ33_06225 [bacterium]
MWERIKNIGIYLIIFIAGGFLGFAAFDRIIMPTIIGSGKAYPIPNIVGVSRESAERILDSLGFKMKVVREEFSTTIPENMIVNQIPHAGTYAKKNRTIRVVLSKGGLKAVVPDVTGKLMRQGIISIEDSRLVVAEVESVYSDSIQTGFIISVEPAPGETLSAGEGVKIIVSKGAETGTVAVPNLVGMKLEDAINTLERIGLKSNKVKRRIPTLEDSIVFKQEPQPGTLLYRGNSVTILVNYLQ